jgi:hypothetical protein
MTTARPPIENRQSFRFPSSDAINGELILPDGRQWPICIVDQSAAGFGILTDSLPPLNCGDLVELRTDSFACETRVVHMASDERSGSDNEESAVSPPYRVGLTRVRDISVESDIPQQAERHIRYRHFRPSVAPNTAALFAIVAVLVGVAVAVIVVPSLPVSFEHPHSDQVVSSEGSPHPSNATPEPQRISKLGSSPVELRRLPGALPFLMTGVINELDLSDAQIERLRRIISDTNDAIAKNDEMHRLLEDARRDAIGVLTHQQRQQWEHLSGETASAIGLKAGAKPTHP